MCTHPCLFSTFFLLDTLLLLSSCRRKGVRLALPGLRGLLGVRLPVDIPVAPSFRQSFVYVLHFRILCIRHFVINVINNIRTRFIVSFYMIWAVIYCSFCCIYVWLDPGTYMIARFMSFYKPGVTSYVECNHYQEPNGILWSCSSPTSTTQSSLVFSHPNLLRNLSVNDRSLSGSN